MKRLVLFAFFLVMVSLMSACGSDDETDVKKYCKKKYDIEVEVLETPKVNTGNMGDSLFTVRQVDNHAIVFDVFTSGLFINEIDGDNYDEVSEIFAQNQNYQRSKKYKELLQKGIYSFLSFSPNIEDKRLGVAIYLLKENGLEPTYSNFAELYDAFTMIKEYLPDKYVADQLYVFDMFDTSVQHKRSINETSFENGRIFILDGLNEIHSIDDFKKVIEEDSISKYAMLENHFYKKDFHLIEAVEDKMAKFGYMVSRSEDIFPLICHSNGAETLADMNWDSCGEYALMLEISDRRYDSMMKKLLDEEVSNFYQTILLLKETGLNITSITLSKKSAKESTSDYMRMEFNLNNIQSETEARNVMQAAIDDV